MHTPTTSINFASMILSLSTTIPALQHAVEVESYILGVFGINLGTAERTGNGIVEKVCIDDKGSGEVVAASTG